MIARSDGAPLGTVDRGTVLSNPPPHDPDAESALLAARVADAPTANHWIVRAGGVVASDYYSDAHRVIALALDAIEARGATGDAVTLRLELARVPGAHPHGLDEALAAVLLRAESINPANAIDYATRVRALARAREMRRGALEVQDALLRGDDAGFEAARNAITAIATQFAATGAPAPALPFLTIADVLRRARERPREWLLERLIPFGAIVLLLGTGKVSGKSTLTWAIIAAAVRGEDLFGRPLPCGPVGVVVLTEETELDVAEKIMSFGIDPNHGSVEVVPVSACEGRPGWDVAGSAALTRARAMVASGACRRALVVVDTWAKWTRLDDENKAGPVLEALAVLESARRDGIAVLALHHPSKAEGREGGNASRGNSALPGEVDATIELRNAREKSAPHRRILHVESRAAGMFDLAVTLVPGDPEAGQPARYEEIGDAGDVKRRDSDGAIVAFVVANPGASGDEVVAAAGVREGTVQAALPRLVAMRRLERTGRGRAGSPYLYWPPGGAPVNAEAPSPAHSRPAPARGDLAKAAGLSPPLPPHPS